MDSTPPRDLPMAGVADVTVLAELRGIDATPLPHLEAVRAVGHGMMTALPSTVPSRIWRCALGSSSSGKVVAYNKVMGDG